MSGKATVDNDLVAQALGCTEASEFKAYVQDLLSLDDQPASGYIRLGLKAWDLSLLWEAVLLLNRSFNLDPNQPLVLQSLGDLLIQQGKDDTAKSCLKTALTMDPSLKSARYLLGLLLIRQRKFDEAIEQLEECLNLVPNSAEVLTNLAIALRPLGNLEGAITRAEQALALCPENAAVHFNLALLYLNNHNWAAGWNHHEWRESLWADQGQRLCIAVPQPKPWSGTNPAQTKLVLVSEQGLGDTLQFVRYAPYLQQNLAELRLCVPDKLVSLISASYPNLSVVGASAFALGDGEDWIPLLSAPHRFAISPEACPIADPYLQVPEDRYHAWSGRLKRPGKMLVGVHWQGNPNAETSLREGRSFPLQALAPLAIFPEINFISLQKGPGSEQLDTCSFRDRFVECQEEVSTTLDFIETAAIVKCFDLVITSDSGLAHLAGALFAPTWLLLHCPPDWRWGKEAEATHWYPSMRLFRQEQSENWAQVIHRVIHKLHEHFPSLSRQYRYEFSKESTPQTPLLASIACSLPLPCPRSMPDYVSGFVINLDDSKERWHAMASQLSNLGWTSTHKRFNAQTATQQEANAAGLRSAGELGLWRTTMSLLNQWLGANPSPTDILHVIEDDVIMHQSLPSLLEPFQSCMQKVDILFTETFLSAGTYKRFSELNNDQQSRGFDITFLNSSQYACGATSYLISVSGARKLLEGMRCLEANKRLAPIDLTMRQFFREGKLNAAISLPFFSTISNSTSSQSTIQTELGTSVALSKNADLELRRLFYFKTWKPKSSRIVFNDLANLLAEGLVESDLEGLIVDLIGNCHSRGLLPEY